MGDVFESIGHGFCLVAPPGYAVVETAPGNFSLVADRCLAFVHGRRVYSLQMMPLSAEAEPFHQAQVTLAT